MRFNNCDSRHVNWVFLVQHAWILCSVFADATTKITQWNPVRCSGYTPPWQNWRLTLVRRKTLIYRMCPHAGLSHQSLCCWAVLKIRAPACFHCAPDCLFMHLHAPHDRFKDKPVDLQEAQMSFQGHLIHRWSRFTMLLKIKTII